MSSSQYALFVTARIGGEPVDEVRVAAPAPFEAGPRGDLHLPVPRGAAFVARAEWVARDRVRVEDGRGDVHEVGPDDVLELQLGAVQLDLRLAAQFSLRRTEGLQVAASLSLFLAVFAFTLLTSQGQRLYELRCRLFEVGCPVAADETGGGWNAEYLARLLREDYAGEDEGVVIVKEPPDLPPKADGYVPAGDDGPITEFGGAEEVAPEPDRSPATEPARSPAPRKVEEPTSFEDVGTPILPEPEEDAVVDGAEGEEGLDTDLTEETPEEDDGTAEEVEGWGIRDWMDASMRQRDRIEIEVMTELAKRRLRIDPNDPDALGLLAYYQYLQEDLDAAEETFDKLIELYPDASFGYNNKALVYKRRGDYAQEEALYRVALSIDPGDTTAQNNLAVNLAHQGRFDEALRLIDVVEAQMPDDAYTVLHRSKILAAMGRDDAALEALERALELLDTLDTMHHIEFRQDIRVDPAFDTFRRDPRFHAILRSYYGSDSPVEE